MPSKLVVGVSLLSPGDDARWLFDRIDVLVVGPRLPNVSG
jgi:hypothetical protein